MYYLHSKAWAHRDLKPENILLDNDFTIKLADFGFAGPLHGRANADKLFSYVGSEPYMAPEIHKMKGYRGDQVDMFALGVIIFCLVTGNRPFGVANDSD